MPSENLNVGQLPGGWSDWIAAQQREQERLDRDRGDAPAGSWGARLNVAAVEQKRSEAAASAGAVKVGIEAAEEALARLREVRAQNAGTPRPWWPRAKVTAAQASLLRAVGGDPLVAQVEAQRDKASSASSASSKPAEPMVKVRSDQPWRVRKVGKR